MVVERRKTRGSGDLASFASKVDTCGYLSAPFVYGFDGDPNDTFDGHRRSW